ncbi:putative low molecular weight protein tyrosine phosphatase [Janibacter sp. HTCC2649]|uniref:low molecular weight protein-tyrosine-phosphatase n=1 Tax=Janibacter sp. HTCC2649 TaxID=313589 RepID=UPI0000670A04|nr:low molecular weight protein-tyrosine-phosphatase [Janibacter sp. HTCC2649]EAQ00834.1 putative low molecular weight protein tyrosine phosphatase [Janibacter sp. HTCC2649]
MSERTPGEQTAYRISVVCTGNICRSPMGEWLLREAFEDAGLDVEVTSAGTSAEESGNPMDSRTIAVLRRNGHTDHGWDGHRAQRFTAQDFAELDLVLAADSGHQQRLLRLAPSDEDRAKVKLMRSFDPTSVAAEDLDMDDPWWGDDASFDQTYAEVRAAVPGIVDHVRAVAFTG